MKKFCWLLCLMMLGGLLACGFEPSSLETKKNYIHQSNQTFRKSRMAYFFHLRRCYTKFREYKTVCTKERYGKHQSACVKQFAKAYFRCRKKKKALCSQSLCLKTDKYGCSYACKNQEKCDVQQAMCAETSDGPFVCSDDYSTNQQSVTTCMHGAYAPGKSITEVAKVLDGCQEKYLECRGLPTSLPVSAAACVAAVYSSTTSEAARKNAVESCTTNFLSDVNNVATELGYL